MFHCSSILSKAPPQTLPVLNSTTFSRLFCSAWLGSGVPLTRDLEGVQYKFWLIDSQKNEHWAFLSCQSFSSVSHFHLSVIRHCQYFSAVSHSHQLQSCVKTKYTVRSTRFSQHYKLKFGLHLYLELFGLVKLLGFCEQMSFLHMVTPLQKGWNITKWDSDFSKIVWTICSVTMTYVWGFFGIFC